MCAGLFPAFHVGRVWMVWFLAPIPNANAIWQNFKSPLSLGRVRRVRPTSPYPPSSGILGPVPDLATLRDRCRAGSSKKLPLRHVRCWAGAVAVTATGATTRPLTCCSAALTTPLVLAVHSVVSFDFATSVVPGWHATIFPPHFVAGAIFGGFAMVLTLMLPVRPYLRSG